MSEIITYSIFLLLKGNNEKRKGNPGGLKLGGNWHMYIILSLG